MGKNTSYTCDRCKYTQTRDRKYANGDGNDRAMFTIAVGIASGADELGNGIIRGSDVKMAQLVCHECLYDMGLQVGIRPKSEDAPPPATFEEILKDHIWDIAKQAALEVIDESA